MNNNGGMILFGIIVFIAISVTLSLRSYFGVDLDTIGAMLRTALISCILCGALFFFNQRSVLKFIPTYLFLMAMPLLPIRTYKLNNEVWYSFGDIPWWAHQYFLFFFFGAWIILQIFFYVKFNKHRYYY